MPRGAALVAALLVLALAAGCGGTGASGQFRVGMVTDAGGLGDQSFNDAALRGLRQAESELQARITVVESQKEEDYEPNLRVLLDEGYDLVWSVGHLMADATRNVARANPDRKFAIIDAVVEVNGTPLPNVASVVFQEHEGSFLVGFLAGKATKTNKVGFVGGMESNLIRKFEAGFKAGVRTANPNAEVIAIYAGSFHDPGKGREIALTMYAQGADVIYHASGGTGHGVIAAAREQNKLVIGVDSDQNHLAPHNVLTSMVKRADVAVFTVTRATKEGRFPGGTVTVLGLRENGVGWSDTTRWELLPAGTREEAGKWRQAIIDGRVKVPGTLAELETWQAPYI